MATEASALLRACRDYRRAWIDERYLRPEADESDLQRQRYKRAERRLVAARRALFDLLEIDLSTPREGA